MNDEPKLTLRMGESEFEATRDNSTLYTHLGQAALFNHLFITTGESSGVYLWAHHSQFAALAELAEKHECVMHLNLPEVSKVDEDNYVAHALSDLGDTIPEDWDDGTTER